MKEAMLLERMESDGKWLQQHLDKLRKTDANKFIAVKDKKIIAKNKKLNEVITKLKRQGEKPSYILIEFIHEKGFELLL